VKHALIGQPKLAYFAAYHALHERVKCVICEMENAKMRMPLRIAVTLLMQAYTLIQT